MRAHWLIPAIVAAALAAGDAVGPVQPVKSPIDEREYRYVVLPNNVRALLIHEPGSDRAAAAASVARGSNQDPEGHEGLAHLVEHLLFVATDKYPEVDGFKDFLREHGGRSVAYTAPDRTMFGFRLYADHLPEALDRFAQFFIAPLFAPDHMEREKRAVDREYQEKKFQVGWQEMRVDRQQFNPNHPWSRIHTGNLETLSGVGVPEVRAFFEANYSADTITVTVLGPHDLDVLQALVEKQFGTIVDRGLGARPFNPPLFRPGTLPASYTWVAFKDARTLKFTFPIPPLRAHYRARPTRYLAELIGHEGPGSLHDLLKRRGWIEELAAGSEVIDERNSTFRISMTLTDVGGPHVEEIVHLTYAWIDLISREGIDAWRYGEMTGLNDRHFRFRDQPPPIAAVIDAAEALANYPPEDVLRHDHLMEEFDEPLIRRYLEHLIPENALVSISSPNVDVDYAKPISLPWRSGRVPTRREVDVPLELPGRNSYIPEDLGLATKPAPPGKPVLLETGTAVETWYAPDTELRRPTARVELRLRPAKPFTPDDVVLAALHAQLVEDAMHARAYAARRIGLVHHVTWLWTGLRIYVRGYHDKLPVLFDDALATVVDPALDAERFAVTRTKLIETYADRQRGEFVKDTVHYLLHAQMWPMDVLIDAAQRATPEMLAAWRKKRLAGMGATLLVHGNFLEEDARSLAALVQRRLDIVEMTQVRPSARRLAGSLRYEHAAEFRRDDTSHALYIQGPSDSIEMRVSTALIGQMLYDRYYAALVAEDERTYIAHASSLPVARHPGIMFLQFSDTGAEELETRTRAFLDQQRAWFRGLSEKELEEHKNRYIAVLTPPERTNRDRMARLTDDLANRVLTFDERDQLVRAVRRLTPARIADAYDALIDPSRGNRLTVYNPGPAGTVPQDGTLVSSRKEFIELTSSNPDS